MGVKLTLDAGALEFLFKNMGEEFILSIKQATLEEVAKRTIHSITTKEAQAEVERVAKEEISRILEIKKSGMWGTTTNLTADFETSIRRTARAEVEEFTNKAVNRDEIKKQCESLIAYHVEALKKDIDTKIKLALNDTISKYISEQVASQIRLMRVS